MLVSAFTFSRGARYYLGLIPRGSTLQGTISPESAVCLPWCSSLSALFGYMESCLVLQAVSADSKSSEWSERDCTNAPRGASYQWKVSSVEAQVVGWPPRLKAVPRGSPPISNGAICQLYVHYSSTLMSMVIRFHSTLCMISLYIRFKCCCVLAIGLYILVLSVLSFPV